MGVGVLGGWGAGGSLSSAGQRASSCVLGEGLELGGGRGILCLWTQSGALPTQVSVLLGGGQRLTLSREGPGCGYRQSLLGWGVGGQQQLQADGGGGAE